MSHKNDTFDDWKGYVFPERELPRGRQSSLSLKDHPSMQGEVPSPTTIDPGLHKTCGFFSEEVRRAHTEITYSERGPLKWFNCSPFEIFLTQVLAEKLSQL